MHGYVRAGIFWVVAYGVCACGSGEREPIRIKPAQQHAVSVPDSPAPGALNAAPPAAAAPPADPAADWDKIKLENAIPLCVFADYDERNRARFLQDVRKQTLPADSRLVFGNFAPGCLNPACDAAPTIQCWVDSVEPNTLVVESRFSLAHKPGAVCTTDCRSVVSGCQTEVLKAGKYTVKYGARTFSLKVPSVLRSPCFKLE